MESVVVSCGTPEQPAGLVMLAFMTMGNPYYLSQFRLRSITMVWLEGYWKRDNGKNQC